MPKDETKDIQAEYETRPDRTPEQIAKKTDRYGGLNPILVELSDALSSEAFRSKRLD